jgi:hypothetical protein
VGVMKASILCNLPRLFRRLFFGVIAAVTCVIPARAMEFSTDPNGGRFISAIGPIISGDAERLLIALQGTIRDRFGNKTLILNSEGGLVVEAMRMVSLMDQEKVSTVVPRGPLSPMRKLSYGRLTLVVL